MAPPLRVGIAGLGTVGGAVLRLLEQNGALIALRAGRELRVVAVSARNRQRERGVAIDRYRWYDDPLALAADPEIDLVVELIGGDDGPALALCRAALAGRQARGHRQQGAARASRRRARPARRGGRRDDRLRGRGRGRHPDRQDAARGPCRQPDPARLRHPERHLQLHPDHDARERARLRRRAPGGTGAGLRRGRPELRHRRHRRRPQAGPAVGAGVRLRAGDRRRSTPRASATSRRSTSPSPARWATGSSCSASRG